MGESRIMMFGTSGSGKTCYMLGMFAEMSIHINNYSLITAHPNEAVHLRRLWRLLTEEGTTRQWPEGTADEEVRKYTFQLNHLLNPVRTFEWIDYRGGSLAAEDTDRVRKQAHEFFLASSCVFLCIDGSALTTPPVGKQKRKVIRDLDLDLMLQDLTYLKQQRDIGPANVFPVVIILTKYDVCRHRGGDALSADLRELLDLLFAKNSGWLVAICPVTLGFDLVNDPVNAPVEPENVHLPVAFAVYAALDAALNAGLADHAALEGELVKEQARWPIARWIFGDSTDALKSNLKRSSDDLAKMEDDAVGLASEIADLEVYLSGVRVDVPGSLQQLRMRIARARR